jgi:hypothetical protein
VYKINMLEFFVRKHPFSSCLCVQCKIYIRNESLETKLYFLKVCNKEIFSGLFLVPTGDDAACEETDCANILSQ